MQSKLKLGLIVLGFIVLGGVGVMIFSSNETSNTKSSVSNQVNQEANIPENQLPVSGEVTPAKQDNNTNPSTPTPVVKPAVKPIVVNPKYTSATVASHSSASSCWTIVSGNVYDLTNWISQHPGGKKAIVSMCGVDSTDEFLGQHGGERRPERELVNFLLGPLSK